MIRRKVLNASSSKSRSSSCSSNIRTVISRQYTRHFTCVISLNRHNPMNYIPCSSLLQIRKQFKMLTTWPNITAKTWQSQDLNSRLSHSRARALIEHTIQTICRNLASPWNSFCFCNGQMNGFHVEKYTLAYRKAFFPLWKAKRKTAQYGGWKCKSGQPLWKTTGIIYWRGRFACLWSSISPLGICPQKMCARAHRRNVQECSQQHCLC